MSDNKPRGLMVTVDLTRTTEEITFTSNKKVHETNDTTAYVHEEVTAQRKNNFPKHFINDGQQMIIEDDFFSYLTPMTVRIQSSKATTYRLERVLYSTLLALQHSDPTARLVVWDYEGDEHVSNVNQVRQCSDLRPSNVKDFIAEPRTNRKSNLFSGRICLLSEVSLIEMKHEQQYAHG
jgi:hypothetical protein